MRSLACVLVLGAALSLCASPAGATAIYRDGSEVPGSVKDADTGYWGIKTSDGAQWYEGGDAAVSCGPVPVIITPIKLVSPGGARHRLIFTDEESSTAYFFVPGTQTSQWEDPRSECTGALWRSEPCWPTPDECSA